MYTLNAIRQCARDTRYVLLIEDWESYTNGNAQKTLYK